MTTQQESPGTFCKTCGVRAIGNFGESQAAFEVRLLAHRWQRLIDFWYCPKH